MSGVLFLFFVMISVSGLTETQDSNILVVDSKSKKENPVYIVKNVNESLELTCELTNTTDVNISLKWILPLKNEARLEIFKFENRTLKLSLYHLVTDDSGEYICSYVNDTEFNHTVTLIVRPIRTSCDKRFECESNKCIASIYKCDGVADCKSKIDESPEICGENPCDGRINCSNGRCIPKEWCIPCDTTKDNCTNRHRPDCCPPIDLSYYYPKVDGGVYPQRLNDFPDTNMHQHYDITFIQTTVYTIIGCALIFMIVVTILVIAICRVHMKRSPVTHHPNNRRIFTPPYHRAFTQEIGVYDLDIAVNRSDGLGLLVTYNINNGVQIVGSPVDPPPYSEVACLPPREGPPPPYTISQPYDGSEELRALRSDESPPKVGSRLLRSGLTNGRVSSEPSLLNLNNRL